MTAKTSYYANRLRLELALRNRKYARGRAHVESYGSAPVIVYAPEGERHGNFFDPAYAAITARADWMRRFHKVHAQAARSLPKAERRWRELDSCTSSDALLMNIFCAPGVLSSTALCRALGLEDHAEPVFGWKARVPFLSGRFDRTEVDLRMGSLLIEAKLTEGDFQTCQMKMAEQYRDLDDVFNRLLLPKIELPPKRRTEPQEFPENYSQEYESFVIDPALDPRELIPKIAARIESSSPSAEDMHAAGETGYASYQLIRNVLAACAEQCSFCVIHDERRPDLREQWFEIMAAVKNAELRTRLKVLTWQELAAFLPEALQEFLDCKYGIVAPGRTASAVDESRPE
ncbi:MAG: PGN_0703 family putative restriction endonuclease [Terracidiphilus sp.]